MADERLFPVDAEVRLSDVAAAYIRGAEEARRNPNATARDFERASDGYVKSVVLYNDVARLADEFDALADEWHAHTDHLSVTWQKELHPTYRYIIGMGRPVVRYILRDLRTRGGFWFSALEGIARRNVAAGAHDWESAVRAWEDWAKREKLA